MKYFIRLSLCIMVFAMLSSCTSEYHYANSYLRKFKRNKKTATEQIYVSLPKQVIHTNSSLASVPNFERMSISEQDSVIASMTKFLNRIDDSVFLQQFNTTFLYTLSRANIPIIVVSSPDKLPQASAQQFTINIAQLEAEEFVQKSRSDFVTRRGVYYAYDYDLHHFATNVWLQLNVHDTVQTVYFKTNEKQDQFRGTVTSLRNQQATMKANFDRVTLQDAYATARELASTCATLYIERLLTDHVYRQKGTNERYFYFNPYSRDIEVSIPYKVGVAESFQPVE